MNTNRILEVMQAYVDTYKLNKGRSPDNILLVEDDYNKLFEKLNKGKTITEVRKIEKIDGNDLEFNGIRLWTR